MNSYDYAKTDKGMLERFEAINERKRAKLLKELTKVRAQLAKAPKTGLKADRLLMHLDVVKAELADLGVIV